MGSTFAAYCLGFGWQLFCKGHCLQNTQLFPTWNQSCLASIFLRAPSPLSGPHSRTWNICNSLILLHTHTHTLTHSHAHPISDASMNYYLAGTLPSEWAVLPRIQDLIFELANIEGTLPSEWSALNTLKTLWDCGYFFFLYFFFNQFFLPSFLYFNQWLHFLQPARNLPASWANMKNLTELFAFLLFPSTLPCNHPKPLVIWQIPWRKFTLWNPSARVRKPPAPDDNASLSSPQSCSALFFLQNLNVTLEKHSMIDDNRLSGTLPPEWAQLSDIHQM